MKPSKIARAPRLARFTGGFTATLILCVIVGALFDGWNLERILPGAVGGGLAFAAWLAWKPAQPE